MPDANEVSQVFLSYETGPQTLQDAVRGLTVEELDTSPQPGKWSIRQIVVHLADAELVYTHRMRKVLAEGGGMLTAFDQDLWVHELRASEVSVDTAIQLISALRAFHLVALRTLPQEAFERAGLHETDGAITVYDLLHKVSSHLHHHVRQIDQIRNRLRHEQNIRNQPS